MKTKYLIPCLLLLCLTTLGQDSPKPKKSNLTISYDKIEDRTNISTPTKGVNGSSSIFMQGYVNHRGVHLAAPIDYVGIIFFSTSRDWRYSDHLNRSLFVLADNERFKFDSPAYKPSINKSGLGRYSRITVSERLIFAIPTEHLKQILRADKIEMKLGQETFSLGSDTKDALKQIVSETKP